MRRFFERIFRGSASSAGAEDAVAFKRKGNEYFAQGQLADAERCYRDALRLNPAYAEALNNLGMMLRQQRRVAEARECLEQAIRIEPGLANAHFNLGKTLEDQGDSSGATACFGKAAALDPGLAGQYCRLGDELQAQGKLDQAVESYRQALVLQPHHADAHNNLGVALQALGKLEEAAASYRLAVAHRPDYTAAYRNLGVVLHPLGRLEEEIASYDQALRCQPDYAEAQMNRGLAELALGRFESGLRDFEKRWARTNAEVLPETPYPVWLGEQAIVGRRVLIQAEQGLGDTLQMVRYISLLEERGATCWLHAPDPLRPLLSRSYPQACVGEDPCPPGMDYRIPAMSLPLALQTFAEESIPATIPYLVPDRERVAHWRGRLAPSRCKRVGLVWRGSPTHVNDRNRSLSLADALPLVIAHPAIRFVSLQKGLTAAERDEIEACANMSALDAELTDFDETAAVMSNLDVVITVDSSPAHLAGALGRPTWILLPFVADWRWLVGRSDTPWYPMANLFRQRNPGDWTETLAAVSASLSRLA